MDLAMYLLAAKRTLAPNLSDKEVIEMCGLGLIDKVGEIAHMYKVPFYRKDAEVNTDDALAELGNLMWYVATLAQRAAIPPKVAIIKPTTLMRIDDPSFMLFTMAEASGSIAESLRGYLFEGKPFDNHAIIYYLSKMLLYIASFAKFLGSDLDTVLYDNVEKLKIRHNITFNSEYTSDKVKAPTKR